MGVWFVLTLMGLAGLAAIFIGAFVVFASGMATVPDEELGQFGCVTAIMGLVVLLVALVVGVTGALS